MIFLGTLLDGLAVLGAVTAEGWRWCLSTPTSIRTGERLTRTVRVVVATAEEIERLNQVRPWFAGHNVLVWLADQEPDTVYDRAPDLMSWARVVLDLRAPDVDWPAGRKVLINRAIGNLAGMADYLMLPSRAPTEASRQAAEGGTSVVGPGNSRYPDFQRLQMVVSSVKESLVVQKEILVVLQKLADSQLAQAMGVLLAKLCEDSEKLKDAFDGNQELVANGVSDETLSIVEIAMVDVMNVMRFLVLRDW